MYLGIRLYQMAAEFEEGRKEQLKDIKEPPGPLAYLDPISREYTIFPNEDVSRLKAYIRSSPSPQQVLRKAGKKGFPLYFQGVRKSFTNGEIYGILNSVTERTMREQLIFHCLNYDQRVHPALCVSRNILYPMVKEPSPYYLEVKEKLKKARTKDEKKRLRRELKKHSPILDPYPRCRSCKMGKKIIQESCLGAQYDPEDKECAECASQKECCQLMRMRIESILAGGEDEVREEILTAWRKISQKRKEVKKEMAKDKKKKVADVTEEVVEEATEEKAATAKERRKAKKEKRERRKERKEKKEKKEKPKSKAEKKEKGGDKKIKALLRDLQSAKEDGDQTAARKIRADLRKAGYHLSAQK